MKIYLASPFFTDEELKNVKKAEEILTSRGFDVFSPRLNEVRSEENIGSAAWSKETFMNDKRFIDWADVVVMLYYGGYSDSGTAWECGYAFGTNTPVLAVHLGEDSNLMIHEGCHSNISMDDLASYDFTKMPHLPYSGKMF
ncbi:MAG: nucleoside 2-deoxyribosyltransferase [Ruminococcus sp.]|nr:nucleoside 2-deoxyribosyltransferase [Ruminococcus sp.]